MSASFRAKSSAIVDAGSNVSVPWPTGHKSGDCALLVDLIWDATGSITTPTAPSGWTQVATVQQSTGAGPVRIVVWYAIATSGAMTNAVIPSAGYLTRSSMGQMFTFSGAFNGAPDVSLGTATSTNAITIGGVTTSNANELVIAFAGRLTNQASEALSAWTCGTLTNLVEYSDVSPLVNGNICGLAMAAGLKRTAGATGSITATYASTDPYDGGCAIVVAIKSSASVSVVSRDATDLYWYPASDAEWTSLLSGTGYANPSSFYSMQDPAGALTDLQGVGNLTPFNAPSYQQALAGHTRLAVKYQGVNDCHYAASTPANDVGDLNKVSHLFFMPMAWSTSPSSSKSLIQLGSGGGGSRTLQLRSDGKYQILGTNGQATGVGSASPGTTSHPLIFHVDKLNSSFALTDDQETIAPTWSAPAPSAYLSIGPDAVGDGTTSQYVLYFGIWTGGAAEGGATQRATLLDRHVNGPAVTSIAVSPSSATIATIGATQALVATATRADTSTYTATSVVTWLSSNPSVATVSASGVVTSVAAGVANITCTYTSLNAATATSTTSVITVSGVGAVTLKKLTIAPASPVIIAGQAQQATATATYSDNSTADVSGSVVWAASSPSIASVGAQGRISGVSAGTGAVTATLGVSAYPTTATALASAVGGTWSGGYLFEDISGSAAAAFGGVNLTPQSTPLYLQPGPLGAGDYAIAFDSSGDGFVGGTSDYDVSATDDLVIAWVGKWSAVPTAYGAIISKVSASFGQGYAVTGTDGTNFGFFAGAGSVYGSSVGANYLVGSWHVGMAVIDRAAGKVRMAVQALDGSVSYIGPSNTIAGSLSVASAFALGNNAWTTANLGFSMAALYVAKGTGAASGMAAGISTTLASFRQILQGSASVSVAPYLSSIDHTLAALSRLPSQFQKPKIQNLIRALTSPANDLEQAMWAVLTQRSIKNALGAQLDVIGGIVGQDRNGLSDDDYRRYISARVIAERSRGIVEDVYTIAVLIVGDTSVSFSLLDDGTATCRLLIKGAVSDAVAAILYTFERLAIEAGVRIILEWSTVPLTATFTLDTGPGLDVGHLAAQIG